MPGWAPVDVTSVASVVTVASAALLAAFIVWMFARNVGKFAAYTLPVGGVAWGMGYLPIEAVVAWLLVAVTGLVIGKS